MPLFIAIAIKIFGKSSYFNEKAWLGKLHICDCIYENHS